MKQGDIVKFLGREEPCVVYRVQDANEKILEFSLDGCSYEILPHIKIEVMGWVPKRYLVAVEGHPRNMFALDKMLHMNNQTQ